MTNPLISCEDMIGFYKLLKQMATDGIEPTSASIWKAHYEPTSFQSGTPQSSIVSPLSVALFLLIH